MDWPRRNKPESVLLHPTNPDSAMLHRGYKKTCEIEDFWFSSHPDFASLHRGYKKTCEIEDFWFSSHPDFASLVGDTRKHTKSKISGFLVLLILRQGYV
jgi:hypothetical protein